MRPNPPSIGPWSSPRRGLATDVEKVAWVKQLKYVYLLRNGKMKVSIKPPDAKARYVGTFPTIAEAVEAYNVEAAKLGIASQQLPAGMPAEIAIEPPEPPKKRAHDAKAAKVGVESREAPPETRAGKPGEPAPRKMPKYMKRRDNGKVFAQIKPPGEKVRTVGTFPTLEEAVEAYNVEAAKLGMALQEVPEDTVPQSVKGRKPAKTATTTEAMDAFDELLAATPDSRELKLNLNDRRVGTKAKWDRVNAKAMDKLRAAGVADDISRNEHGEFLLNFKPEVGVPCVLGPFTGEYGLMRAYEEAIGFSLPSPDTSEEENYAVAAKKYGRKRVAVVKGLTTTPEGKYEIHIRVDATTHKNLGTFDTPTDAVRAYNDEARRIGSPTRSLEDLYQRPSFTEIKRRLEDFVDSGQSQVEFPSIFNAYERRLVHSCAFSLGLKSKSRGRSDAKGRVNARARPNEPRFPRRVKVWKPAGWKMKKALAKKLWSLSLSETLSEKLNAALDDALDDDALDDDELYDDDDDDELDDGLDDELDVVARAEHDELKFKTDDAVRREHGGGAKSPEELIELVMDMTNPGRWYPTARTIKRNVHLHVGPTNSGKTWNALQRLKEAESGVYCSPLRLLAWEVAEGLNKKDNLPCDLVTGQEKSRAQNARHVACTVEMADVHKMREIGVIDEGHLMGDAHRGYAFTRALIGLPVKELHVCGDPAMVPLVEKIVAELGDTLTINRYDRLQELNVIETPLKSLKDVEAGDCLVAFSRKAVHQLKDQVEREAGKRACIIYGSLPPEARSKQAELFNNREESGYDVLIASDAIGMGLNLSIRRVIFASMRKFDGEFLRNLEPPEVKQIAGRAGRYGKGSTEGGATTMSADTLPLMKAALAAPVVDLTRCSIAPTLDQIALYCEAKPDAGLVAALSAFTSDAKTSPHYFMNAAEQMTDAAKLVAHLPLSLEDHWMFAVAPVSVADPSSPSARALVTFAEAFVKRGRVSVRIIDSPPMRAPATLAELDVHEQSHAAYDLYLWFSLRCPEVFPERDLAQAMRQMCAAAIDEHLRGGDVDVARLGKDGPSAGLSVFNSRLGKRLNATIAAVQREEEKLEEAGFGEDDDEDGIFSSVSFDAPSQFTAGAALKSSSSSSSHGGHGSGKGKRSKLKRDARGKWTRVCDNGGGGTAKKKAAAAGKLNGGGGRQSSKSAATPAELSTRQLLAELARRGIKGMKE
jgi:ATP-dependent RNA helicase SUPV3L1/SUV3